MDIAALNERVASEADLIQQIKQEMGKMIIGQEYMLDRLLIGLFTGGHILLEGVPGLAKTLTVETLSRVVGVSFKRLQFTPDLLPADILGTVIYYQKTGEFITKQGPIFHNIILADEINRAPAKVQSALLEAMQENQVTIGENTFPLEQPFLVMATQNPLEQEGTYPLPEAQQDRFMLKLKVDYPAREEELAILNRMTEGMEIKDLALTKVLSREKIFELRKLVRDIYLDDKLKTYIVDIVFKSRDYKTFIQCGASPRATINLVLASKGKAFLEGRGYVKPDDIKAVVYDVLRHRLLLTYEAEAEGYDADGIIKAMLEEVRIP